MTEKDPKKRLKQLCFSLLQENADAKLAYNEYHDFISKARDAMKKHNSEGIGLLVDFHGHAHSHEKIEIGYLFRYEV